MDITKDNRIKCCYISDEKSPRNLKMGIDCKVCRALDVVHKPTPLPLSLLGVNVYCCEVANGHLQ